MNGPSEETFRRLFQNLHKYKQQAVEAKKKAMLENGKVKQPPCVICGRWFGSQQERFIVATVKPKQYCPSCQKNLDDGFTALVSVDGRFAFTRFPDADKTSQKAVAGKVMTISNDRMEMIQGTCMWITDDIKNTRCEHQANWEMSAPGENGVSQTIRLCSAHKNEAENLAKEITDTKLRQQVVESFKAIVTVV